MCCRSSFHSMPLCVKSKTGLKLTLSNLVLTGFISGFRTTNKTNLFLNEVNFLCLHEKITPRVRENKKADYCTAAREEMNSSSGPNMATITTRHSRLPVNVDTDVQITPSLTRNLQ